MSVATPTSQTPPKPYRRGDIWRIDGTCTQCAAGLSLDSETEPNYIALKFVKLMCCDQCAVTVEIKQDAAYLRQHLADRVRRSGLPPNLQNLGWADMDRGGERRDAIVAARAWSESGGKMLLTGAVGAGKTRLAATAVWDRLQRFETTWINVPLLFVHAFMPSSSPERRRAIEVMGGTGALVLDDLGKEKPGDWARQILYGAIDSRIQAASPIIVTSNFNADQLGDRLGEAVGSRLFEFHQYELAGRDRRTAPAQPLHAAGIPI